MLVDAEQELNVILQIPVYIKVSHFHPARQLKPGRSKVLVVLIHNRTSNLQHDTRHCVPSYFYSDILLISLSWVGGHNFVQRLELFLVLNDGLCIDLHS